MPEDIFLSTDNSTIHYSVDSTNGYINREFGNEAIQTGYYFFRPYFGEIVDDFLVCADKFFGLRILDISDLENIELVSELMIFGEFNGISVETNYAVLSSRYDGVHIIDITDKYSPLLASSSFVQDFEATSVLAQDDYVYISGSGSYNFRVMDVSNISDPQTVSSFNFDGNSDSDCLCVTEDDIAIVSDDDLGLRFYNISDRSEPEEIGTFEIIGLHVLGIVPLYFENGEKYIIYNLNNVRTYIADINDLSDITVIWDEYTSSGIGNLFADMENKRVYMAQQQGLVVINITTITDPIVIFKSVSTYCTGIDVIKNGLEAKVILSCDDLGVFVIDVDEDLLDLQVSNEYGIRTGNVEDILSKGNYVHVIGFSYYMILDVSNKFSPNVVYYHYQSMSARCMVEYTDDYILILGSYIYSFYIGDGIESTYLDASFDMDYSLNYFIAISGTTGYISRGDQKLEVLDISDVHSMSQVNLIDMTGYFLGDLFVSDDDDYLFVSHSQGYHIFDISIDPENPIPILGPFTSIVEESDQLYYSKNLEMIFTRDGMHFTVFNVTNQSNPILVFDYDLVDFYVYDMKIDVDRVGAQQLAYLACNGGNFIILDVSDPYNITMDLEVRISSDLRAIDVSDNDGYVYCGSEGGIHIFGNKQLVLYDNLEDSFYCGSIIVTIEASDDNSIVPAFCSFEIERRYNSSDSNLLCKGMGDCVDYVDCDCFQGWDGRTCDYPKCFNISTYNYDDENNNLLICSGHGVCIGPDDCLCTFPNEWYGFECQYHFCFGIGSMNFSFVCGGGGAEGVRGSCVETDKCLCNKGYGSEIPFGECNLFYCNDILYTDYSEVCSQRGTCIDYNTCVCDDEGYEGEDCETWSCGGIDHSDLSRTCNGRGECTEPSNCVCRNMYMGKECETNLYYYTVMTPLLGFSGIIISICVLFTCYFICCLCCVGFVVLILCLCGLTVTVAKQTRGLKRFSKLKNFDLLLKEQELEEDTSVAHLRIDKELFMIEFDEIILEKILGEGGSNSIVYQAIWNDKMVAFKCFKTRSICDNQSSFDEFEREVAILGSVRHPNILQFFGCSLKPPRIGILMEFCENGDLLHYFSKAKNEGTSVIPFIEKLRICYEIILPMTYLHSRNIIHRDLKLENVLLDQNYSCKLMDFGLSKIVDRMSQLKTKSIGTSYFMAPEILRGKYDEKIDVFAFGMCAYMIMAEDFHPYGISENVMNIELRVATDPNLRPDIGKLTKIFINDDNDNNAIYFPKERLKWLSNWIQKCWDHKAINRPNFSDLSDDVSLKLSKIRESKDNDDDDDDEKEFSSSSSTSVIEQQQKKIEAIRSISRHNKTKKGYDNNIRRRNVDDYEREIRNLKQRLENQKNEYEMKLKELEQQIQMMKNT